MRGADEFTLPSGRRTRCSGVHPAAAAAYLRRTVRPLAAMLLFHAGSGARCALRASVPLAGAATLLVGLEPVPEAVIAGAARDLVAPGGPGGAGALLGAVALGLAAWAAPRIAPGHAGWMRHLPVTAATHRRAATLALAFGASPVLVTWAGLWAYAAALGPGAPAGVLVRGLLVVLAAAHAAARTHRSWLARPLALGALVAAIVPGWAPPLLAALLLVAADAAAGALARGRSRRERRSAPPWLLDAVIAWRALGPRAAFAALLGPLAIAPAWFFARNNPGSDALVPLAVRCAATLAAGVVGTVLLSDLALRRPPWPFARTLPRSAAARVTADAALAALHALPALLCAAFVAPGAALAAAAALPLLAFAAAGAVRAATGTSAGPLAPVLAVTLVTGVAVGVSAWAAVVALALAWPARRWAAAAERDLRVGRWEERAALPGGETAAWSER